MAVDLGVPDPARPVRPYAVASMLVGIWAGALAATRGAVEPDGALTAVFLAVAVVGAVVARFGLGVRLLLRPHHTDPLTRIEHVHHIAFFASALLLVPALLVDPEPGGATGLWVPVGAVVAAPLVVVGAWTLRRARVASDTDVRR
ncbi:hypothetical protein [Pseudonocardia humida]|uniref:Uncharacterized protein n=1 Tax=Pseudonocardia humida TaxID=2800819 RepID=A0ABT1A552_9PSEU|nr:hypothetical protein [Pseudonocardia humida]MCO1658137.1 hypothetical protein [Pseudonocardia humida]